MEAYRAPPEGDPGFTLDEMKQFVAKHFDEFVNRKNPDVARENFSADFLDHDEPSGPQVGAEAAITMMKAAFQKWPDLHVTIEDMIAERDKVMVRNTWRSTDAATGHKIEFHGFVLWRFANRKIVERWATLTAPRKADD
jgi:predicted ester cyclase